MRESFDDYPVVSPPQPQTAQPESFDDFPAVSAAPANPVASVPPVSGFSPTHPADPNARISAPLAGAGPNGEDVPWYAVPPAVSTPIVPDSTRLPILAANAVGRGATSLVTGIPDLVSAVPQVYSNMTDPKAKWSDNLFPLTRYAIAKGGQVEDKAGVPQVQPENEEEKLASNVLEYGTGALSPMGTVAKIAKAAAPVADMVGATHLGSSLASPMENFPRLFTDARIQQEASARAAANPSLIGAIKDVTAPTAAKLAAGAGAGAGATLAQEEAPDSPMAALVAAYLGSHGGVTAAKGITGLTGSMLNIPGKVATGTKLEPEFADSKAGFMTLPPSSGTVDKAARLFQDLTENKDTAIANIEQGQKDFAGDAVQPTPANMSKDIGLLRMEKGARLADQKTGNSFIKRDQALAEQNLNDFASIAPSETGNKQAVVDTIAQQTQAVKDAAAAKVAAENAAVGATETSGLQVLSQADKDRIAAQNAAQNEVLSAKDEATKLSEQNKTTAEQIAATPRMPRAEAGKSLVEDILTPAKQAQRDQYEAMIAPFEKDNRPIIDTSSALPDLKPLERYKAVFGEGSAYKGLIDHVLAMKPRAEEGTTVIPKTSPAEMLRTEQDLNRAIRQAKASSDGNALEALGTARDAVGKVLESSGLGDDFAKSRTFYRENIAEPFNQGASKKVLAAGASGEQYKLPASESVSQYFQSGPKGGESMDQLISAAGGKEKILPQVQGHVVDNIVDKFYNPTTQKWSVPQLRKYLNDNREALNRVPEIRDDWTRIANQLDNGKQLESMASEKVLSASQKALQVKAESTGKFNDTKNQVNESLQLAKQKLAQVQKDAADSIAAENKSAARYYLNDPDPDKAIAKLMQGSQNPTRELRELKNRVDKDPSGKASLGLKEAIYDHLQSKIEKAGKTLESGQSPITPADMQMLAKNRKALVDSGIFSAADGKVLDTLQKRIETSQRGVDLKATAGSPTAENTGLSDTQKAIARSSLRTIFGGFEGGNKYSILKDTINLITGADAKAQAVANITKRALLDPQLAVLLLKRDLSKFEESTFRTKINRVITNRTALAVTDRSKNNE